MTLLNGDVVFIQYVVIIGSIGITQSSRSHSFVVCACERLNQVFLEKTTMHKKSYGAEKASLG